MKRCGVFAFVAIVATACAKTETPATTDTTSAAPDTTGQTRPSTSSATDTMAFKLTSSAFAPNGKIPSRYTCEGDDLSPPLQWSDAPGGTKSFALIVDDPDAPDPAKPKMVYVHWVVYRISASTSSFPENGTKSGLPAGAEQGTNDFGKTGYGGPCPPIGRHRYFFKLYALDTDLANLKNAKKADVEKAIQGHTLGQAELMGTYQKGDKP